VHHVPETGSTNADLLDAYERGLVHDRCALVADHQTAGRGRLDRRWEVPPGTGLLVSILFEHVPEVPTELTHRVGLSAVRACRILLADREGASADPPPVVGLKWPNDLLLDERKLGGILAQRVAASSDRPRGAVVVGLGLNVSWAPPGAARLGAGITPADVLREMLVEFDALPASIGDVYRRELLTLRRRVRVELPGGAVVTGVAVDVDPGGRLVVRDGHGAVHRFDVGDVIHAQLGDA
jgi:BirA family biotin operon repressor/biotin-[acetyl-CoA-carboxylase] ligase